MAEVARLSGILCELVCYRKDLLMTHQTSPEHRLRTTRASRWARMRRSIRWVGATLTMAVLAVAIAVGVPTAAQAAGPEQITSWNQKITVNKDGSMRVRIDFDYDFGGQYRHGPMMEIVTAQYTSSGDTRYYPLSDVTASSSTGAPAQVNLDVMDAGVAIKIGDPDSNSVTGTQSYTVEYTQKAVMNSPESSDFDELYWNVIGNKWRVPINDITVTVEGPAAVENVACFSGRSGVKDPCGAVTAGDSAVFTHEQVSPGQFLTINAGFPKGSTNTEPILGHPYTELHWGSLIAAAILLVAGSILIVVKRRSFVSWRFAHVPAGVVPPDVARAPVYPVKKSDPAPPMRFSPPQGLSPGQAGFLQDYRADTVDVTATIVDLAVQGHVTITEMETGGEKDWLITAIPSAPQPTKAYEVLLCEKLFATGSQVKLSDLQYVFVESLQQVREAIEKDGAERGWFMKEPAQTRKVWHRWFYGFLGGAFLAAVCIFALASNLMYPVGGVVEFLALSSPVIVLLGLSIWAAISSGLGARTPLGTALNEQLAGFQDYLSTRDPDVIETQPGKDIFSLFLPYAIVMGVASTWAATFAKLAGVHGWASSPSWYHSPHYGDDQFWHRDDVGTMFDDMNSSMASTLSTPEPSSDGSSGGGGGSSGGGGGGGGGGSW